MLHPGDDNISPDAAEECYNMEFRSYPDDAWYNVRVVLEGERGDNLRVKYDNFPDDHDHVFRAESFESKAELYHFIFERFRKLSAQLQDSDCYNVIKGIRVCASHSFSDDDFRFYDAIVEDVCVHLSFAYAFSNFSRIYSNGFSFFFKKINKFGHF